MKPSRHTHDTFGKPLPPSILRGATAYEPMKPSQEYYWRRERARLAAQKK